MAFLTLMNSRLDYLQRHKSAAYFRDTRYFAKRWAKRWKGLNCADITLESVENYFAKRAEMTSSESANIEARYLRAAFNWGIKMKKITVNPLEGFEPYTVEEKELSPPPLEDILKVIEVADDDTKDYLWTVVDTMGRISEINRLKWADVDFKAKTITLRTRKKKGGNLTPRKIPLTRRLWTVLKKRYDQCDKSIPWVFHHRYWSRKTQGFVTGPYAYRKRLMRSLCKKAKVNPFSFHRIRHFGGTVVANETGGIHCSQRILGHQEQRTTERYIHPVHAVERQAMEAFEKATSEKSHTYSHSEQF